MHRFTSFINCYNRGSNKIGILLLAILILLPITDYICLTKFVFNGGNEMESKIEILSTVSIKHSSDLYKIVDALNRTLKRQDLMFGLALDEKDNETAIFTIYRT
jgi:hypothetical protein